MTEIFSPSSISETLSHRESTSVLKIRLVTQDSALQQLCGEILAEFANQRWTLSIGVTADPEAGLCIWDYDEEIGLPPVEDSELSKYLILLPRQNVLEFQDSRQCPAAMLVLKPVTRAALRAFLGQAISGAEPRLGTAGNLRSQRDQLLQCLIQTNLKLQEYDQGRTNFLARGLHDFRAPLTAISGYCALFLNDALGTITREQRQVLERMQRSAKRLARLSAAMLELSVERRVKRCPEFRHTDLQDCFDQALHEVLPSTESKHLSISADLEESHRSLQCEPGAIEQLLINILENACKYTPRNGKIEIRGYPFFWERRSSRTRMTGVREYRRHASFEPNSYRIEIRNSGALIPDEHLEAIFEEYTSLGSTQDHGGAGLGLAICRMIILQHRGRIWVENTPSGPKFIVLLPIRFAEPVPGSELSKNETSKYAEVLE